LEKEKRGENELSTDLEDILKAVLSDVRIFIDIVGIFRPPNWQRPNEWRVGDYVVLIVEVTNNTNFPLRDVIIRLELSGINISFPAPDFDGNWYWSELEPNERKSFYVLLEALEDGWIYGLAWIYAEIVPYVGRAVQEWVERVNP